MSKYASQIRTPDNCGLDYASQNPLVIQAYMGFSAYDVMYQASCLKDSAGAYCFADAITNVTLVADSYPYYLPFGLTLPSTEPLSCDPCVQQTMQTFANNPGGTLLANTYPSAAQQINSQCGTNYVPTQVKSAAFKRLPFSSWTMLFIAFVVSLVLR
jgi:hypothetical protein